MENVTVTEIKNRILIALPEEYRERALYNFSVRKIEPKPYASRSDVEKYANRFQINVYRFRKLRGQRDHMFRTKADSTFDVELVAATIVAEFERRLEWEREKAAEAKIKDNNKEIADRVRDHAKTMLGVSYISDYIVDRRSSTSVAPNNKENGYVNVDLGVMSLTEQQAVALFEAVASIKKMD